MAVDFVTDKTAIGSVLDQALAASKADETEAVAYGSESALTLLPEATVRLSVSG